MSEQPSSADSRAFPRLKLPAMYTLLRAKKPGDDRYGWSGHLYDISMTGIRFELDLPIEPGQTLQVRAMLPGQEHTTVRVEGKVVRIHDDEDAGPVRMGMTIDRFLGPHDRIKLMGYLGGHGQRMAA